MNQKINSLLETSKQVTLDCCLENGAIVAANADKEYYPNCVQHYRYVWPRDSAYICVAADMLGINNIQESFFNWLWNRAEGLQKSKLLFQNYYVNGPKRWLAFQPDNNGSVLWAIHEHYKDDLKKALKYKELITTLADGICKAWNGKTFNILTQDLWEERLTCEESEDTHTYSLAACAHGLELANKIIPDKKWFKTSEEMKKRIMDSYSDKDGYFLRTFGKLSDKTSDASLLGLVYPFSIVKPEDKKMISTVEKMEKEIVKNKGVYRYAYDYYDSFKKQGIDFRRGAGSWPLLTFWLSIYYSKLGNKEKALEHYNAVLERIDKYIPEQLFDNDIQKSVNPLCWSHAMFIFASKELGYF
ncbi:hypothetical protein KY348_07130 [Candidatus Woesearchaeota archaeon]|nr:hypothetical protein [Candidatus Woesearchaeota archaeon]